MKVLHSTILGSGQPLLILHGYFGMSDNWKSLGVQFAINFEVHLIDQRNHGRSFHSDEFDYELMVEDLYFYIEQNHLKNVILLGHSMGGKVTMQFAVTYPELVSKLIVADISPKYYKPHHEYILAGLNSINFTLHTTRKKVEEALRIYIEEEEILQFLLKNVYWKSKGKLAFRFNLESLTENNVEVGEALPSFTHFDGKTLFLSGENSNYITKEDIPLISAHFINSHVVTVKNAGHWLHAENPIQFYNEVVSFLA
ncbi:alpha/beta fold hydrolase [uncultured Lutibacter sp.]|uniref:alpha/beta fold hydrolase n=1 Tax=uncultured Lutibacter sp. TaxID=437739 RepID=UPI002610DF14|nr:alpha/beta fold hydrolase [uncultured Lutibacter sp.]